jgi:hypothetical protein
MSLDGDIDDREKWRCSKDPDPDHERTHVSYVMPPYIETQIYVYKKR